MVHGIKDCPVSVNIYTVAVLGAERGVADSGDTYVHVSERGVEVNFDLCAFVSS